MRHCILVIMIVLAISQLSLAGDDPSTMLPKNVKVISVSTLQYINLTMIDLENNEIVIVGYDYNTDKLKFVNRTGITADPKVNNFLPFQKGPQNNDSQLNPMQMEQRGMR